jgi:hypothetical protein
MKLTRCPICHGQIHLEALVQDESGRQLMAALVPLSVEHGSALVGYIGLFRSHNRDLANDRALRLVREVLELGGQEITPALAEVIEAMRSKAQQNPAVWKPLSNHNYLKRVIEGMGLQVAPGVQQSGVMTVAPAASPARMTSKTAQGLMALEAMKAGK